MSNDFWILCGIVTRMSPALMIGLLVCVCIDGGTSVSGVIFFISFALIGMTILGFIAIYASKLFKWMRK